MFIKKGKDGVSSLRSYLEIEIINPNGATRNPFHYQHEKRYGDLIIFVKNELKNYKPSIDSPIPLIYVHLRKNKSLGKIEIRRPDGRKYFLEMEKIENS